MTMTATLLADLQALGVASEGGEAATESNALLRAADSALKRAKSGGRNRTALADDSGVAIDAVPPRS